MLYMARVQIVVEATDETEAESVIETFLTETGVNVGSKIVDWTMLDPPSLKSRQQGSRGRRDILRSRV